MHKQKHLLVIANLRDAAPRIPCILEPLFEHGWKVTIITSPTDLNEIVSSFPMLENEKNIQLVKTEHYTDVYEWLRKLGRKIRKSSTENYEITTNQLKTSFGNSQASHLLLDWLLRLFQSLFAIPDTEKDWTFKATKKINELEIDWSNTIVLSSSPYPSSHILAATLTRKYFVQWIADFRDPWSNNHNYRMFWWRQILDAWLEKKTIKHAAFVTTVSSEVAKKIAALHSKPVFVVKNGFKRHQPNKNPTILNKRQLQIVYTGRWYPQKQSLDVMLDALKIIRDKKLDHLKNYQLNFFGPPDAEMQFEIDKRSLTSSAIIHGSRTRNQARDLQHAADMLFAMGWEDQKEQGIVPLKFLEYLDAKKNIVVTCRIENRAITEMLYKTKSGIWFTDADSLATHLVECRRNKLENGSIQFWGNEAEIEKYTYRSTGQMLLELLSDKSLQNRQQ